MVAQSKNAKAAPAPMPPQAAAAAKKERGEGPVVISYLDDAGKMHKRVPTDVKTVRVLQRSDNTHKDYSLADLGMPVILQLAANGFGKKADIVGRNVHKADPRASVTAAVTTLFDNLRSGKFTARAEGKGAGRKPVSFDINYWLPIYQAASAIKRQNNPKRPAWSANTTATFNKMFADMPDDKTRNAYVKNACKTDKVLALEKMRVDMAQKSKEVVELEDDGKLF